MSPQISKKLDVKSLRKYDPHAVVDFKLQGSTTVYCAKASALPDGAQVIAVDHLASIKSNFVGLARDFKHLLFPVPVVSYVGAATLDVVSAAVHAVQYGVEHVKAENKLYDSALYAGTGRAPYNNPEAGD